MRVLLAMASLMALGACSSGKSDFVSHADICRVAAARVPALFADLDWIRQAPRDQPVFSGTASGTSASGAYDDPDAAGALYLTLREIDLDADGDCDLVGTVSSGSGSAGSSRSHLVYWFADAKGWKRQGPVPNSGAKGLNPVALELFGPAGPAEMAVFGAAGYATSPLERGRVALVLRPQQASTQAADLRLLAFDSRRGTLQLLVESHEIKSVAEKIVRTCQQDSPESEACSTW